MKTKYGQVHPTLYFTTPDGKRIKLSGEKKYVLICDVKKKTFTIESEWWWRLKNWFWK